MYPLQLQESLKPPSRDFSMWKKRRNTRPDKILQEIPKYRKTTGVFTVCTGGGHYGRIKT